MFIFSNQQGKEADALVRFGLTEGSNRVHPGQGTRNRKFYFDNFFLEIIWVHDEKEVKSERIAPLQLWERANHQHNKCSPLGICLSHTEDSDELFENSLSYQPVYFPEGVAFDVLPHEEFPDLPWTCRLPLMEQKSISEEPKNHPVGIRKLTKIRLGIPNPGLHADFTAFFDHESKVTFEMTESPHLTLEFDHIEQGLIQHFRALSLTIAY